MKRSQVVKLISDWAKKEILDDVYSHNYEEWADNLLYTLENELGMFPPINNKESFLIKANGEMTYAVHEWEPE